MTFVAHLYGSQNTAVTAFASQPTATPSFSLSGSGLGSVAGGSSAGVAASTKPVQTVTTISTDPNNTARLGSDGGIYVPAGTSCNLNLDGIAAVVDSVIPLI